MAMADLTCARLRELLSYNPEKGTFIRLKIGKIAGCTNASGYIQIRVCGHIYYAHRLAWLYMHECWPADQIDHQDGNRSNNAIANLREASSKTNRQNLQGARSDNSSGLLGAWFNKAYQRWQADIVLNKKKRYLGRFDTAEDAHQAYLVAKREMHPFCTI